MYACARGKVINICQIKIIPILGDLYTHVDQLRTHVWTVIGYYLLRYSISSEKCSKTTICLSRV